MARNFQKELDAYIKSIGENTPRLLLHSCCAPCSSYVLWYLARYFHIILLYYNPNIEPEAEYRKRVREQKRLISEMPLANKPEFIEGIYEPEKYHSAVHGYEGCKEGGERCKICYEMRLREAARAAIEYNCDYFTTTLTISPLKNAELINEIGGRIEKELKIPFLPSDFKKKNGYKISIELSKEYGLYRQNYCGCVYSSGRNENV